MGSSTYEWLLKPLRWTGCPRKKTEERKEVRLESCRAPVLEDKIRERSTKRDLEESVSSKGNGTLDLTVSLMGF